MPNLSQIELQKKFPWIKSILNESTHPKNEARRDTSWSRAETGIRNEDDRRHADALILMVHLKSICKILIAILITCIDKNCINVNFIKRNINFKVLQ